MIPVFSSQHHVSHWGRCCGSKPATWTYNKTVQQRRSSSPYVPHSWNRFGRDAFGNSSSSRRTPFHFSTLRFYFVFCASRISSSYMFSRSGMTGLLVMRPCSWAGSFKPVTALWMIFCVFIIHAWAGVWFVLILYRSWKSKRRWRITWELGSMLREQGKTSSIKNLVKIESAIC